MKSRLARLLKDFQFLDAALRPFDDYVTHVGTKEDLQSEASRQPSLEFGTGSEEDYD